MVIMKRIGYFFKKSVLALFLVQFFGINTLFGMNTTQFIEAAIQTSLIQNAVTETTTLKQTSDVIKSVKELEKSVFTDHSQLLLYQCNQLGTHQVTQIVNVTNNTIQGVIEPSTQTINSGVTLHSFSSAQDTINSMSGSYELQISESLAMTQECANDICMIMDQICKDEHRHAMENLGLTQDQIHTHVKILANGDREVLVHIKPVMQDGVIISCQDTLTYNVITDKTGSNAQSQPNNQTDHQTQSQSSSVHSPAQNTVKQSSSQKAPLLSDNHETQLIDSIERDKKIHNRDTQECMNHINTSKQIFHPSQTTTSLEYKDHLEITSGKPLENWTQKDRDTLVCNEELMNMRGYRMLMVELVQKNFISRETYSQAIFGYYKQAQKPKTLSFLYLNNDFTFDRRNLAEYSHEYVTIILKGATGKTKADLIDHLKKCGATIENIIDVADFQKLRTIQADLNKLQRLPEFASAIEKNYAHLKDINCSYKRSWIEEHYKAINNNKIRLEKQQSRKTDTATSKQHSTHDTQSQKTTGSQTIQSNDIPTTIITQTEQDLRAQADLNGPLLELAQTHRDKVHHVPFDLVKAEENARKYQEQLAAKSQTIDQKIDACVEQKLAALDQQIQEIYQQVNVLAAKYPNTIDPELNDQISDLLDQAIILHVTKGTIKAAGTLGHMVTHPVNTAVDVGVMAAATVIAVEAPVIAVPVMVYYGIQDIPHIINYIRNAPPGELIETLVEKGLIGGIQCKAATSIAHSAVVQDSLQNVRGLLADARNSAIDNVKNMLRDKPVATTPEGIAVNVPAQVEGAAAQETVLARNNGSNKGGASSAETVITTTSGEIVIKVGTYEQARNKALELLKDIDFSTGRPHVGRLGVGQGKIVGRKWYGNKVMMRLDYDPIKGPHINVTDYRAGKSVGEVKIAILFEGTLETVENLLKQLNR